MACILPQGHIPSVYVDIIIYLADRNDWRKITQLRGRAALFFRLVWTQAANFFSDLRSSWNSLFHGFTRN